jgi:hypothetical protein
VSTYVLGNAGRLHELNLPNKPEVFGLLLTYLLFLSGKLNMELNKKMGNKSKKVLSKAGWRLFCGLDILPLLRGFNSCNRPA